MKKILFIIPDTPNGSHYHRLNIPAAAITHAGFQTFLADTLDTLTIDQLRQYDAVVVSRLITTNVDGNVFDLVAEKIKQSGIRLIVDLDDIWTVPKHYPNRQHWLRHRTTWCIKSTVAKAHQVWVSTEALKREVDAFFSTDEGGTQLAEVLVTPNGISPFDAQWNDTQYKMACKEFRIGINCNSQHHANIAKMKEPLRLLKKVEGWRLMAVGVDPANEDHVATALGMKGDARLQFRPWLTPYDYSHHYAHIDLQVCPLERIPFNTYRSDIKLAEAAQSETPIWCENFGPYAGTDYAITDWQAAFRQLAKHIERQNFDFLQAYIPKKEDHSTQLADQRRIDGLHRLLGKMEVVK